MSWQELQTLLPPPSTLTPATAERTTQLPTHFAAAVTARHTSHTLLTHPPSPQHRIRAPSLAPLIDCVKTLCQHFSSLNAQAPALRKALEGPCDTAALHVSEQRAREAIQRMLPLLKHFAELEPLERATWLAGVEVSPDVVEAGCDQVGKVVEQLSDVFQTIKQERQKVETRARELKQSGHPV